MDVLYKTGFGNCSTSFKISRRNAERLFVIRSASVDLCARPIYNLTIYYYDIHGHSRFYLKIMKNNKTLVRCYTYQKFK